MAHSISSLEGGGLSAEYRWRTRHWNEIRIQVVGKPEPAREGSHEQFITEHYWGYAAQRGGGSVEYRVTHPAWRVWSATRAEFDGDAADLYGENLAAVLKGAPASALLAEGSAVTVMRGKRITGESEGATCSYCL